MPKVRSRRRRTGMTGTGPAQEQEATVAPTTSSRVAAPKTRIQNVITAALVALGCWGFAFTYVFMTTDPNRYLFGGLAAVLAVMWTINFWVRLRKWQQQS